jgi:hypothetical protein
MVDREFFLETLKFLKEKKEDNKNYVNPKDSPEFANLSEETQERIRDKIVLNGYASMPNIGKKWELAITWHPGGGVDILNRSHPKFFLTKDGSISYKYKIWISLKKHAITIIVAVIGGILVAILLAKVSF